MMNLTTYQAKFVLPPVAPKPKWLPPLITVLKVFKPGPITVRVATLLVMTGLLLVLPAVPALAQAGDQISGAIGEVVTTITDIIQSLTVVVGILGVTMWGFGKVARPIFPEIAQLTSQYIGQFVIGVVVVFVAATVVEGLVGAIGI
jgi:hypothetical protein